MKLTAFLALFLHASISLPDGALHIAPAYCIPGDEAPPSMFNTDFRQLARASEVGNCDQNLRAVRLHLNF